ncbi:MAG: alanine--tRNA ligase [Pirellulaceae bacterium]|nr:alanine--tRNA ligase [Pirellulaceae bacterium]
MHTNELRSKYLEFFESKGHSRRQSDVLVPAWDPSVLFTPAGMNQFKPHFLGKVKLDFTRATTCQKCLRTGDIDNVGRTAYHHTFFEMLGNFSFGDYFKRDAIHWAWEFLTSKDWLAIDSSRLSVTVYVDDHEAAKIWQNDIGLSGDRIERMDEEDNFWPASSPSQGPDGVCGPCSEIFYKNDRGQLVEIWNLVFTQFNRVGSPPDNLRPLPSKNIDTGMGLERTAAVLQGVETNYHIDILRPIVEAAAEVCGIAYEPESENGRRLRRITDHVRACTFSIHENVYPGPHKEKYVIRRLLRRAVLDGHQIGRRDPFLYELVPIVAEMMRVPYPELTETRERVANVIEQEEKAFFGTIDDGLQRIERIFASMQRADRSVIDGAEAADLYQTYGVPAELFESLASDHEFTFDWKGFQQAMAAHGEASGKLAQTVMGVMGPIDSIKKAVKETRFLGYEVTSADAEVKGIIQGDQVADQISKLGEQVIVVLDQTPFYGESGGQVGDAGEITGETCKLIVNDTQKDGDLVLHYCELSEGVLAPGAKVGATVDLERRDAIRRAHSATHILHHALQKTLGSHAQQQGSKVTDDWLRFDFTNMAPIATAELEAVIDDVRCKIQSKQPIVWEVVSLADAREAGAMMLFGEKYPDPVRMVSMGDFSRELCGGTHLDNTADVGAFEIITEEGVSAGTRRIVALTGAKATEYIQSTEAAVQKSSAALDVSAVDLPAAVKHLALQVRDLKKELSGSGKGVDPKAFQATSTSKQEEKPIQVHLTLREAAKVLNVKMSEVVDRIHAAIAERDSLLKQLSTRKEEDIISAADLIDRAEKVGDVTVVVAEVLHANSNVLRQLIDQLRKAVAPCVVFLATSDGDSKVILVAGVSRDLVDQLHAGNLVKQVAPIVGGGGGGKPDMAQAGGKDPTSLPQALEAAQKHIRDRLNREA